LLGQEAGLPIERLLGIPTEPRRFRYTVILGDGPLDDTRRLLDRCAAAGIRAFKIKLGGDRARDRGRLEMVHDRIAGPIELRLDANNLWGEDARAALAHLSSLGRPFDAVEEPLAPRRAADLADLSRALGVGVVLDESLCHVEDLARYDAHPARWI